MAVHSAQVIRHTEKGLQCVILYHLKFSFFFYKEETRENIETEKKKLRFFANNGGHFSECFYDKKL